MDILYISSVTSKKEFYETKKKVREGINVTAYGMSEAGFKFHSLIQNGLIAQNNINVCSLVGRSIGYKTHKGIFWKAKIEEYNGINYKHLTVINLPVIKQFTLAVLFFFDTLSWLIKHRRSGDKAILIDAAYVTVIPSVMLAARFIHCKKAGIFADVYEYMGDVNNDQAKHKTISKIMRGIVSKCYDNFDGFILITEQANGVVNRLHKPYIIMEGLVDIDMKADIGAVSGEKDRPKFVLYAGALREQYGLKSLVDGFMSYSGSDVFLEIYGDGDYIPEILKAVQNDSRIRFMGLADNDEIVRRETKATLLVNPRPVGQEFTQYSFPSKNMEYMVSGTPVLTTKLPGMPDEYYDYVFTIDGDSAEDITKALYTVLSKPDEELVKKGLEAREFVLKNKNNMIQAQRILNLFMSGKTAV